MLEASERVQGIIDAAQETARRIEEEARREAERYVTSRRTEADDELERRAREVAARLAPIEERLVRLQAEVRSLAGELDELVRKGAAAGDSANPAPAEPGNASAATGSGQGVGAAAGLKARLLARNRASRRAATRSGEGPDAARHGSRERPEVPAVHAFPGRPQAADQQAQAGPTASTPQSRSEQALLRATQMAVAGSPRDEIERALREELGVEDPAAVLAEVLGPGDSAATGS